MANGNGGNGEETGGVLAGTISTIRANVRKNVETFTANIGASRQSMLSQRQSALSGIVKAREAGKGIFGMGILGKFGFIKVPAPAEGGGDTTTGDQQGNGGDQLQETTTTVGPGARVTAGTGFFISGPRA